MLAGVPVRAGTAYRFFSPLFTRRVREHRRYATKHELDYSLGILAAVLPPPRDKAYLPRIVLPEASKQYAREALAERGLARKSFAIVHPGSAKSARNLPIRAYAALADFLERDLGVRVLVTAGSHEAALVAEMDKHRKARSLALVGAPGLLHLAAVIAEARLFISGSTGPMHLAGAVGTPTLAFFSPVRSTSPRRWRALGSRGAVIQPPVPQCPTCIGKDCEYFDCMERIPLETVKETARQGLETCR
jgi:ADP-heptose:LPS heptosyltransferase